jgi:pantoate--beta-alanine ligase
MRTKRKVHTLQKSLIKERKKGNTIGFVPTMGALHDGHLSLINAANQKCNISVCSIFVNPTQFNDPKDLKKYPRNYRKDAALLRSAHCNYLFYPTVETIYPSNINTRIEIDLEGLDTRMEGAFRPGHFAGVVEVVNRLLEIVQPDYLFMGQKDFQQFTIIQHMLDKLNSKTNLVVCPIMREQHGLARSSRNERLDPELRKKASIIYSTLKEIQSLIKQKSVGEVIKYGLNKMKIPGFRPEYLEIIDGTTLLSVKDWNDSDYLVACTAVWAGEIRLIDNIILKK